MFAKMHNNLNKSTNLFAKWLIYQNFFAKIQNKLRDY